MNRGLIILVVCYLHIIYMYMNFGSDDRWLPTKHV